VQAELCISKRMEITELKIEISVIILLLTEYSE